MCVLAAQLNVVHNVSFVQREHGSLFNNKQLAAPHFSPSRVCSQLHRRQTPSSAEQSHRFILFRLQLVRAAASADGLPLTGGLFLDWVGLL